MSRSPKRYRGVVLTQQGIERLEASIATAQDKEKYGKRFTQAELSERAKLSIKTIKKIRDRTAPVDEVSVRTIFEAFELSLEAADYGLPELPSPSVESEPTPQGTCLTTKIDWGEKPDTATFFGRTDDLATLDQWVMADQCRLITLLGMGGIGKTALAAKLADQIYEQFDYVIWRSLREAPPLDEILVRLIQFLSNQQETEINLPTRLGERIIRLLHYLREHSCLLVLDNLESILQAESAGQFRDGYEGYRELIHRIGGAEHQSCLLLTSRECPRELALMAGDHLPVRLWPVEGIDYEAGQEILKAKGLNLEDADNQGQELIRLYSGNPQALHLVATAIRREYLGDVEDFLEEEGAALEDVRSLLDQHLTRLAPLERSILFWLAINREPVGIEELMEDLLPPVTKRDVRSALTGLCDRYLIEATGKRFTLQNVIMEFATDRFVERVGKELERQQFDLFHNHSLIKVTTKDYIRETQIRLILKPVIDCIDNIEQVVNKSLKTIRKHQDWPNGYIAGSLMNMLCRTQPKVSYFDFSNLSLRQAYIEGMQLHKINLACTSFINSSFTRLFGRIGSVALQPNGELMATGDSNGQVRIWDINEPQRFSTLEGHTDFVSSVSFSPDGQWIATGSADATVRLWNSQTHECVYEFTKHTNAIWSVAFSPDGNLLIAGGGDAMIWLWDIQKHRCIYKFKGHTDVIWSVAFSPNGELFASCSKDATIRLWNVRNRQCIHVLKGHTNAVRAIAFSPDGQWFASGSADHTIRLWNVQNHECIHTFTDHTNLVRTVAFSPDGQILASGSGDHTIRLWDYKKRLCIQTFTKHDNWVLSLAFSSNGKMLASGSEDATIRLWNLQQYQCVHTLTGYTNRIRVMTFSPDGRWLASGGEDTVVRLWDTQKLECVDTFIGHCNWIWATNFSPNGQYIVSSSGDYTIRLWDIQQRKCIHIFTEPNNLITSLSFSPNGRWIATGDRRSTLKLWDTQKIKHIYTFTGHNDWVKFVAFSPNGQWIATGSKDETVRLWDIEKQICLYTFTGHSDSISSITFSPDSRLLASSSLDTSIRLWDIQKKTCVHTFNHSAPVWLVSFRPNGRQLASKSGDTIKLWDIQQQACINEFSTFGDWIRSATFSPDGLVLATGSNDGTIRLWDIETGRCKSLLRAPRPYEGTNITGAKGLNDAQRDSLIVLGAVDSPSETLPEI
ncbi:NB-ARC domain-containing protein [Leptothoe sp. ISB3NOV94-8A]